MNYLSIDTEYSGFYSIDPGKSGELLQVACIAVVDGVRVGEFNEKCKPLSNRWSAEAQKVHRITQAQALTEQHPKDLASKLLDWIQQFDRVFTAVGWNCSSDQRYIERLAGLIDLNIWLRHTRPRWHDAMEMAKKRKKMIQVKNWQLSTLCKYFGVGINAHDALSDARATLDVLDHLSQIPTQRAGVQLASQHMSEVEKYNKYLGIDYLQMNGDGCVYITEKATRNKEALRIVMEELWRVYVDEVD